MVATREPAARTTVEIRSRRGVAVLVGGCDGYPAGTTGVVTDRREGCAVFVPDDPERVARWAHPRSQIMVPDPLVAVL